MNGTMRVISAFGLAGTAVEHNDVILTLGLHTTGHVARTPISHVFLLRAYCPIIYTVTHIQ